MFTVSRDNLSKEKVKQQTYQIYNRFLEFLDDATLEQALIAAAATIGVLILLYGAGDYMTDQHEYNLSGEIVEFPDYNVSERDDIVDLPNTSGVNTSRICTDGGGEVVTVESRTDGVENVACNLSKVS